MRTRESMANNVQRYDLFMKKQTKLTKNLHFMQKKHPFCNFCYKKDDLILFFISLGNIGLFHKDNQIFAR